MKHHAFPLLILVVALSVKVNAQGELYNIDSNKSCEQYKIGIITPSKDIDFKITVIFPPKDMDQAMVFNPCSERSQGSALVMILPRKETNEFFKVPPFTIKNKYAKQ